MLFSSFCVYEPNYVWVPQLSEHIHLLQQRICHIIVGVDFNLFDGQQFGVGPVALGVETHLDRPAAALADVLLGVDQVLVDAQQVPR